MGRDDIIAVVTIFPLALLVPIKFVKLSNILLSQFLSLLELPTPYLNLQQPQANLVFQTILFQ
jgi:hypothetical protein